MKITLRPFVHKGIKGVAKYAPIIGAILALIFVLSATAGAQTFKTRISGAGNWSAATTWIQVRTGTISITNGSATVTGTGTAFTTELAPGDVIMLDANPGTIRGTIATINSNTSLTLTANATQTVSGAYGRQAVPTTTADIQIGNASVAGSAAVTLDVSSATVNSLTFFADNQGHTLTHSGTNSLTVTNNVTINEPNGGTFTSGWYINSGTATVGGNLTITGTTVNTGRIAKLAITTGTLNLASSLVLSNTATATAIQLVVDMSGGAGTMNIGGSIQLTSGTTATLTPGSSSTINFNGSGTQIFATGSSISYNNISVNKSSGSVSPDASFTISGNVNISAGALDIGSYTLSLPGNWTNNGMLNGTGTVNFTGTGAQTISGSASQTFYNISLNKSAGTTLSTSSVSTLTANNLTQTTGNFTAPATLTLNGNLTISAGTLTAGSNLNIAGNWVYNGGAFTHNSGTVTFNGTGAQSISGTLATSFNNLSVTNAANALTVSTNTNFAGTLNMNGASTVMTPGAAVVLNSAAAAGTITGTGKVQVTNVTGAADFSSQYKFSTNTLTNLTVEYAGTTNQNISNLSYSNLSITGGGYKYAVANLSVSNNLNIASGATLLLGTYLLSVTPASYSGTGYLGTANTSSTPLPTGQTWPFIVTYYATGGGQTVVPGTYNGTLYNYNTSGTNTSSGNITVNGTLNIAGGGTLSMSTYTLSGNPTVTGTGTLQTASTSATPIPAGMSWTGTVEYNAATGGQTVVGASYTNLTLSNTSGINNAGGAFTVSGTLTTNAGAVLDMGNYALSTVGTLAGSGSIRTQNTSATPLPVGKTWTGTVEYYKSTGGQTIVAGTYTNLLLSNSSSTQTAGGALSVSGTLTIPSGTTMDMVTNALSGALTASGTGSLKTQNTSATPLPSGVTWTCDVYYNSASAQTIVAGSYNNLDGSGGARTLSTLSIAGNFTAGSGVYTVGSTTITFNGTGTQSISATAFYNLTINNTGTATFSSGTCTVSGQLNVSNGGTLSITGGQINETYATNPALNVNAGGTVNQSGGTISVTGQQAAIYGTFNQSSGTYLSSQTLNIGNGGVLNQSGGLIHMATNTSTNPSDNLVIAAGGTVNQTSGTIYIKDYTNSAGTFNQNGASAVFKLFHDWKPGSAATFYSTSGTVEFAGAAGNPNFAVGAVQFNNILIDASGNPAFGNTASSKVYLSGNFTNYNTALSTSANATFYFNGSSTQNVSCASTVGPTFGSVVLVSGSSVSMLSNIGVGGNWTNNGGTLSSVGNNTVYFTAIPASTTTVGGTIGGTSSTTFPGMRIYTDAGYQMTNDNSCTSLTIDAPTSGGYLTQTGTTTLTVNGDVTINQPTASTTAAWNINGGTATVSGSVNINGSATKTGQIAKVVLTTGTLNIGGDLAYNSLTNASGVVDLSGGAATLNLNGSLVLNNNFGTLTPGTTSNVYYNGTGAQVIGTGGAISYYNLTVDKTSGTATLGGNLSVTNMTLNQGTFNGNSYTITLAGNWVNNTGAITGTPNLTLTGITKTISGSATSDFGNINVSSKASYTLSSPATCTGLTITPAGFATSLTQTMTSSLTVNGNVIISQPGGSVIGAWNINTGTATVNGNISLSGTNTNNARVGKISITSGTLNANGNITFNSASANPACAVIDMSGGTGTLNITGSMNLANGSGTLTSSSTSVVNFNGTSPQTVGFGSQINFNHIYCNNSSSVTLSGAPALTDITGDIRVQSGTFDNGGYAIGLNAGKTFEVVNGATFKVSGTSGMVTGTGITKTFGPTSTVSYCGTNQTVSAETYGHLILTSSSGAAVKTMPATAFTVSGNLTSSVGSGTAVNFTASSNITVSGAVTIGAATTFGGGSYTHTIGGNWTNNGTYTPGTSTLVLSGASTTLSGSGTHTYNNLTITGSNVTATPSAISLSGNLTTSGIGSFTHSAGTLTMSGSGASISGSGIALNNLTVSGSVSTGSTFGISGNLSVGAAASLSANAGTITMSGASKTISSSGALSLYGLTASGSITTSSDFSIASALTVSGSLTASAGTATFTGTSILSGTANLYNVTLNGTSLRLSTNSVLGIAGNYTISAGALNVTSSTPNTVNFNGSLSRNIPGGTFHHLIFSGNTNTAAGNITVNGNLTINSATTYVANGKTLTLRGNFVNNGTFTAATDTVVFNGSIDATLTGATTFNVLRMNKNTSAGTLTLASNVNASVVDMTSGNINTGANTLNITSTRINNGIILGNIKRTHAFTTGVAYEFESPNNSITFSAVSGVSSVTVAATKGSVATFPYGGSVNRLYNITVPAGTYTATLRLHYEDVDLNGVAESSMNLWKYTGGTWVNAGNSALNTTSNYVEQSGLTNIAMPWTLSDNFSVANWTGAVSSDWSNASNWSSVLGSASLPPSYTDIVQIGFVSYTNAPVITTAASAKSIYFGDAQASSLSLSTSGSLTVQGNISGQWTTNKTHTVNVNSQTLTVNGDMILSDGTSGHAINLNIGSGTVNLAGGLTEDGGANVTFTGAGNLNLGSDFVYNNGTFTAGTGTVTYNGTDDQLVGPVSYKHLTINKSSGIATINSTATIGGNLAVNAGELDINAACSISGNVTIASGATIYSDAVNISLAGNWSNSGTFLPSDGTITVNGSGTQTISASAFNNLVINKSAGTALLGNIAIDGDVSLLSGSTDLATYTADRNALGGTFTMSGGTTLYVGGSNNFPANYATYSIASNSTVNYNGTGTQSIAGVGYGNLVLSNGGANAKTFSGNASVAADLAINSGATLSGGAYTVTLAGNWTNSGTYTPSSSTVNLTGTGKSITGTTTFNALNVSGTYTVAGSNITCNGAASIAAGGSLAGGSGTLTFSGDLTNQGALSSTGTVTYTGTLAQTIQTTGTQALNIVNFNGSVSPTLITTNSPTYNTVNINNTAGISSAIGWTVNTAFNVATGASFTAGNVTHLIKGSFTNNGTVSSSGTLNFTPSAAQTIKLNGAAFSSTGTVIFGGTGAISVSGTPTTLTHVTINNSTGVTPASNWTMGGTFSIGNSGVFNASGYSYSVGGNISSSGTLNGGTSAFTMTSSAGTLAGSLGTTFYDLTLNGNITALSNYNVSHNFTNNGSYDGTSGVLNMTGSLASTIGGSTATYNLAQLTVQKTGGASTTLAHNIGNVASLNINSGILDAGSYTIMQDATNGGSMSIAANTSLKIGGTNALPTFTTYTIDSLSTVEYNGTTQTVTSLSSLALSYGNLSITASGTKTANGSLNIRNNFTLSSGTFVPGAYSDTLGGNWTMSSGTFTNTGSTLVLNGANTQTVSSTGGFNNVVINKPSNGVTLSSNMSIGGSLTFTLGKITTGSYSVITTSGTVTGASQTTGWVNGNLQRTFSTTTSAGTFDVGGSNYYSPLTLTFASITGGAAALTASATEGIHPSLSGSGITSDKTIPVYWKVTNTGGLGFTNYTASLTWNSAEAYTGINTSLLKVGVYASSAWTLPTVSGTPTTTNIAASGITALGDMVSGEPCNLSANFSYTGTPYCQNGGIATVTYNSGGSAGTFSYTPAGLNINTTTGAVNLGASVPGTYNVTNTVTGTGGCSSSYTTTITVTAPPTATISYAGSPYCSNGSTATVTRTGSSGGTYSSTAGLSINATTGAVNLSASTPGTYTVTYTIAAAGGCSQFQTTTSITITTAPSATISYTGSPYCTNGGTASVTLSGTSGGTFSSTAGLSINASTGAITLGTSTAGTYTVTYTVAAANGCSQYQTTTSVTISLLPSATISYAGSPFCTSSGTGTVTRTGTAGGTYTAPAGLSISTSTGDITPGTSTPGTYTVTYTMVNGGCTATATTFVTITAQPSSTIAYTGSPYCTNSGSATVTLTGTTGGAFSSTTGLSINSGSGAVTLASSTPGSYTVTYTIAASGGCSQYQASSNITVQKWGTWTGASSSQWFDASNWLCGGVPTSSTDVTIPAGLNNYPSIDTGTASVHDLTIASGASFIIINSGTLKIGGAVVNSGTFNVSNGSIEMNGSSAQHLSAFYNYAIKNLTLNNSAGVTLDSTLKLTGILKATTGTFNANDKLTLKSSASQTALIDGSGNGSVTGNVTMERYLPSGFGYRYISSAFQSSKVSQLSGVVDLADSFATLYKYDEDVAHAGWVKYTDTSYTLNPWAGYAANFGASTSPKTISITGVVNNGTISNTLYNHNQTYTLGFNLVGNPYPSPIDWNAANGWTKTNIDNAIYYFNNGTTDRYQGAYSSYVNGVSSDGVASNIIPSMQGFFVHVSNGSYPVTATLASSNGVRVTNLSPAYHKQAAVAVPTIRLSAGFDSDTAFSDPTVVYFDNSATSGFEQEMDARKMLNTDERVPSLYSFSGDDKLAISAIPQPDEHTKEIPLGIKLDRDGQVLFKTRDLMNMPAGMHAYFADVERGIIQDLEQISGYKVQLNKGSYDRRFYLMFSKQEKIGLPGTEVLNAYTRGTSIFVPLNSEKADVVITNALGQVVKQEELVGSGLHEIRMDVASGIYIISMSTNGSRLSKKLFLGN